VTSTEVFEHVPDDRRGFSEAYRNFGSDIGERLQEAGFTPEFRRVNSDRHRIRSQFVVVARKPPDAI